MPTESVEMRIFWAMAEYEKKETLLLFAGYSRIQYLDLISTEWEYIQEHDRNKIMKSIQENT